MKLNSLTAKEQGEITEVLEQFGLNEKDRVAYLALLSLGASSVTPLSRAVSLPVTTTQSVLERLDKKGLLNVSSKKSKHVFSAKDPAVLKKILERKIEETANIIPLLKKLLSEEKTETKIRIFNRERAAEIFHEALETKNKLIYEIVSAEDLQLILGEKFHFTKRRVERGIYLKSLRVEKHEIKRYNRQVHERELREAKFLPREMSFRSSIMFWDNKVAFFTTKNEGLSWVVESAVAEEMMLQFFEMFWSVSRKMDTITQE